MSTKKGKIHGASLRNYQKHCKARVNLRASSADACKATCDPLSSTGQACPDRRGNLTRHPRAARGAERREDKPMKDTKNALRLFHGSTCRICGAHFLPGQKIVAVDMPPGCTGYVVVHRQCWPQKLDPKLLELLGFTLSTGSAQTISGGW